jgi:hypothetical protein
VLPTSDQDRVQASPHSWPRGVGSPQVLSVGHTGSQEGPQVTILAFSAAAGF